MNSDIRDMINKIIKLNEDYHSTDRLNEILSKIPDEVIENVGEFIKSKTKIIFNLREYNDIDIYLYNDNINKTPTSSISYPKNIYINLDHLSDFPKIFLGDEIGDNIYINVYYAILHELCHVLNKHKPTNPYYSNYDDYINSSEEQQAMAYSDRWLKSL